MRLTCRGQNSIVDKTLSYSIMLFKKTITRNLLIVKLDIHYFFLQRAFVVQANYIINIDYN